MVTGVRLVRHMDEGATRPFLVEADDGELWVAKGHRSGSTTKYQFNELVTGRLACVLGIPWPRVEVLQLEKGLREEVARDGLVLASDLAVGIKFVPDLRAATWPRGGYSLGPDFVRRNRVHVLGLFPAAEQRMPLYGKNVFDNWVFMKDTKYETLQILPDGSPMFLDASHAFGGEEWNASSLVWDATTIDVQSPYLEGVLDEPGAHRAYLERLRNASPADLEAATECLPPEWGLDPEMVEGVQRLIRQTRERFLPEFERSVEWEELGRS